MDWRRKLPSSIGTVFGKKLTNTAMAPAKLNRHFTTNHGHLSNKTTDYFQQLLDSKGKQCKIFEKKVTMAQEASYLVAELVAQKMKSYTTAESLIMPACKIIVKKMIGKEAESEIDKVPVSNNTISRHVDDMSHDTEDVLSETLKNTNFALRVDESMDVTSKAQLLALVRF
jgi:hypothetical protein